MTKVAWMTAKKIVTAASLMCPLNGILYARLRAFLRYGGIRSFIFCPVRRGGVPSGAAEVITLKDEPSGTFNVSFLLEMSVSDQVSRVSSSKGYLQR